MTTQTEGQGEDGTICRKGSLFPIVFVSVMLGGIILAALAVSNYSLASDKNPIYWKVPLIAYGVLAAVGLAFRKKLFDPYSSVLQAIGGVLSLSAPFAFMALGLFLFLNGALDKAPVKSSSYFVSAKPKGTTVLHLTNGLPISDRDFVVTQDEYDRATLGGIVEFHIGAGFFHQPWMKGYKIVGTGGTYKPPLAPD